MAIGHLHISNELGILGENTAANLLVQKGYTIRERNWKMAHLEVDIIAENSDTIVFAEVKTRSSSLIRRAEENVDEDKERNMTVAANAYIRMNHITLYPRFDIIGIVVDRNTQQITELTHLENAFQPRMRTVHAGSFTGEYKRIAKSRRR